MNPSARISRVFSFTTEPALRRLAPAFLLSSTLVAVLAMSGCATTSTTTTTTTTTPVVRGPADCAPPELVSRLMTQRAKLFDAMERGDRAVLEDLTTERFTFVHSSGASESRAAFIDHAVRNAKSSGAHAGHAIEFLEDDLRLHDGMITWVDRSAIHPKGEATLFFRAVDTLVEQGGKWRWVGIKSTRVTGADAGPLPGAPQGCAVKPPAELSHG